MTKRKRLTPAKIGAAHAEERGQRLRSGLTAAIMGAVFDELSESGYAAMSMEGVARRAGAGKAALYRRWPSKEAMVLEVVSHLTTSASPIPDRGSLAADVRSFVEHAGVVRRDLKLTRIVADLSAEAIRKPQLAKFFSEALRNPRREAGARMLKRAVLRGELPRDLDYDLALDCLVALTYSRPQSLSATGELADQYTDNQLAEVIQTALKACRVTKT